MSKEDILYIVKSVLQDSVSVSDISDSGYVDFYIATEYVASPNWCQKAYERKYDLIDEIMAEIEKEIEKEEKLNEEEYGNADNEGK